MDSTERGDLFPSMDPQIAALTGSPYIDPDTREQQEVDEMLRKKRKQREHKACYPCRQRKVKCDLQRPCVTCKERGHAEMCSYEPPSKRQNTGQESPAFKIGEGSTNGEFVTLARSEFDYLCRRLNALENSIADLKRDLGQNSQNHGTYHGSTATSTNNVNTAFEGRSRPPTHTELHGVHVKNDSGEFVHLGSGSIPAMLYALQMKQGHAEQHQIQEMLGKTVLPLFGLDNESATYPFVDLWGLPHGSLVRAQELAKALPTDTQMLNLFRCYRDIGYLIYAGIASPKQFESDLTMFLINRAAQLGTNDGVTEQQVYGKNFSWLALLFAVLASGAQCSTMPRKERELTSQVYVCCSFECLRIINFLAQSNLESIQSLVVISNVMANNLNAGTSWAVMGLTMRLAQSLGLHRACPENVSKEEVYPRSKIWWAILWQDSLLSITYDRASAAGALDISTMPPPQHFGDTGAYHATMYSLSKVGLAIVRDRARPMNSADQIARITEHRDALVNIMNDCEEYLRDSRKCHTARETIEHWGLYLHSSYHMAELCRPAISPNADPELVKAFKPLCLENLVNTVEAFLGLNNITTFARQSWAALHRALGAALLLCIIGEHMREERAKKLVGRFINVMADITNNLDAQEISGPILRSLSALRKLGIHERRGSRPSDESAPGSLQDGTAVAEDGSLKLDQNAVLTPSNPDSAIVDEEQSPFAVLNAILWGNSGGYPMQ